jgi:hypothetical protein|nr:MAG TPA_asm: protease [Caudoviricetes sp.]
MNTYSIEVKVPGRERLEQIAEQVLEKYYGEKITVESREKFTAEPDFTALAITGIGRAWIISKNGGNTHASVSLQIDSYAIGSGSMIARAVMHCDKDAEYAVKVATELDLYSGGDIQTFTAETEMQKRVKDE